MPVNGVIGGCERVITMNEDWELTNWTMKDKGEEIIVFFELFCMTVIIAVMGICKIIDWFEK